LGDVLRGTFTARRFEWEAALPAMVGSPRREPRQQAPIGCLTQPKDLTIVEVAICQRHEIADTHFDEIAILVKEHPRIGRIVPKQLATVAARGQQRVVGVPSPDGYDGQELPLPLTNGRPDGNRFRARTIAAGFHVHPCIGLS